MGDQIETTGLRYTRINFAALFIVGAIVFFNVWHISIRSFWPGSIINCVGIGPNTIDLARQTFPDVQIKSPYDGQFCFAIAHDPLLITGRALPFVDVPIYRYRRLLFPLLTWGISLGQPTAFPIVLFLINIASWIAVGVVAWRLARLEQSNATLAVIGAVTVTGLQFSAMRTLTEPLSLALLLWGLWYLKNKSFGKGILCMGLAVLARETSLVAFASVAGYYFVTEREHRLLIFRYACLAFLPAVLWNLYLPQRLSAAFHPFSVAGGPSVVFPFVGFVNETRAFLAESVTRTEWIRTFAITIETVFLMGASAMLLWWRRSLWSVVAFSEAVFCSMVRGEVWNFFPGSSRVVINLTVFVLFGLLSVSATPSPQRIQK